ncbi:zinc finger, CCHC-type, retrotransposon gag domain protein [Tanacetum coccineum]
MVNTHHKEFLKASMSKGVELLASDAERDGSDNGSSSSSEDLNFRGFTDEEARALSSMIKKQVGMTVKNVMPYFISQTTDNLKEIVRKELEEFKKGGIMNDFRNEMATYHNFMACDVPKFDGVLDPIASTRWLAAVEGAFRTSNCKEKNKVNFASNFLHDSAKIWWEGKFYEKGEEWIGACTWKEFKELFNAEFTPTKEINRIREEFQTLTQTSETINEMWKKFNDLIRYCPEYHRNEKLKVERFQRMLHDDIREVISPFKCTTLDDLLSRARVREANLLRKKSKEAKKTKRKLKFGDRDAKKPKKEKVEKAEVLNPKSRVYVMAAEEDKLVHDVVTGTIIVNSLPARVLYDSGTSVSFLSYKFSKNLSTPSSKLPFLLEVEIPDSKVVVVFNVYRDVKIEIDDSNFRIDLIPIMFGVFDIVIGIDWLDKHNANILCRQKLVRVINMQGYTSFEKKCEKDVSVVNEFLDVFIEDLKGIPPERQVEF